MKSSKYYHIMSKKKTPPRVSKTETVEEFLARGGKIKRLPSPSESAIAFNDSLKSLEKFISDTGYKDNKLTKKRRKKNAKKSSRFK